MSDEKTIRNFIPACGGPCDGGWLPPPEFIHGQLQDHCTPETSEGRLAVYEWDAARDVWVFVRVIPRVVQ